MDEGKMDKFVFAVAQKKTAARLHKDIYDLVNKLKAIVFHVFLNKHKPMMWMFIFVL